MVIAYFFLAAIGLCCLAVALWLLLFTAQIQRLQSDLYRQFAFLRWPFTAEGIERYFMSRYAHYQTKAVGLVVFLAGVVILLKAVSLAIS